MKALKILGAACVICLSVYGLYALSMQIRGSWYADDVAKNQAVADTPSQQSNSDTQALEQRLQALETELAAQKASQKPAGQDAAPVQAARARPLPVPGMTLEEFQTLAREDPALEARIAQLEKLSPEVSQSGAGGSAKGYGAEKTVPNDTLPAASTSKLPDPGRVSLPDPGRVNLPD